MTFVPYPGTLDQWEAERALYIDGHSLSNPNFVHDNLIGSRCACQMTIVEVWPYSANSEGRICAGCGGSNFRRTGSCMTCTDCGSSDGCG